MRSVHNNHYTTLLLEPESYNNTLFNPTRSKKRRGTRKCLRWGEKCMLINHKAIHDITVEYTLLVKQLHPFIVSRHCYRPNRPSYSGGCKHLTTTHKI